MTGGPRSGATRVAGLLVPLLVVPSAVIAAEGLVDVPKLVNFTIVVAILVLALRKPLAGFLDARTEQIRQQIRQRETWKRETASLRSQAASRKSRIEEQEEATVRRIREAATEEAERIVAEAEAQAVQISEQAQRELEERVGAAEGALRRSSARAAARIARARIPGKITDADRRRLLDAGMNAIHAD